MAVAAGSPKRIPYFKTDEDYVHAVLVGFLAISGYSPNEEFGDLSTSEQRTVLRMARAIKKEMES